MPLTGSNRLRTLSFATLLLVGLVGVALTLFGAYRVESSFTLQGVAILAIAGFSFLVVQFASRRSGNDAATAVPVASTPGARKIEYDYEESQATPPMSRILAAAAGPVHRGEEDLVEFELVKDEVQVPTHLSVPPAFEIETRLDAAGPERLRITTGSAMARRKEIVSGLPLVSSILADEPPAASLVTAPPPGKTRGQCSACGTMLWAPRERPIRLRCPRCGHVRTLTG